MSKRALDVFFSSRLPVRTTSAGFKPLPSCGVGPIQQCVVRMVWEIGGEKRGAVAFEKACHCTKVADQCCFRIAPLSPACLALLQCGTAAVSKLPRTIGSYLAITGRRVSMAILGEGYLSHLLLLTAI